MSVTPAEQIAFIAKEFPHLEQKTRTTQTSFGIKEMGARGRAIRIKHSNGELKLAATALRFPDRQYLYPKFKGPPDVLRQHVEGELEVLHNEAPGSGHTAPPVRNWQIALRALAHVGGKATRKAILDEIRIEHPAFDPENLRKDLTMLSVNDDSRFSYRAIETRRTGSRADRDLVFRGAGHGDETVPNASRLRQRRAEQLARGLIERGRRRRKLGTALLADRQERGRIQERSLGDLAL
ncbi:hypothetical protein [Variovorax sp. J31P207]|uniref:hypothetical protein n=1 Tax=Variovorax sp. J31P207 TaxID=3053510 RepID=UPI002576613D|nr:hypothetical protein [Variovorax sp. J31P207]MDM0065380.1 hypothetical protein [Variovorax sp. J31P207]